MLRNLKFRANIHFFNSLDGIVGQKSSVILPPRWRRFQSNTLVFGASRSIFGEHFLDYLHHSSVIFEGNVEETCISIAHLTLDIYIIRNFVSEIQKQNT